jgi:hypothetical protein
LSWTTPASRAAWSPDARAASILSWRSPKFFGFKSGDQGAADEPFVPRGRSFMPARTAYSVPAGAPEPRSKSHWGSTPAVHRASPAVDFQRRSGHRQARCRGAILRNRIPSYNTRASWRGRCSCSCSKVVTQFTWPGIDVSVRALANLRRAARDEAAVRFVAWRSAATMRS